MKWKWYEVLYHDGWYLRIYFGNISCESMAELLESKRLAKIESDKKEADRLDSLAPEKEKISNNQPLLRKDLEEIKNFLLDLSERI